MHVDLKLATKKKKSNLTTKNMVFVALIGLL